MVLMALAAPRGERAFLMKTLHRITPLISVCLLAVAIWILYKETRKTTWDAVMLQIRAIPARSVWQATGLVVVNYMVLSVFDILAFRYIRHPLPNRRTLLVGFICHTFGNTIGSTLVTGGSVRLRFYSKWGISVIDIGKVVLFCGLTFWIGLSAVAGVSFVVDPIVLPADLPLPLKNVRPVGVLLLTILSAYLLLSFFFKKSLKFRGKELAFPPGPLALVQTLAGAADLLTISGILYLLLPVSEAMPGLSYPVFLGYFMVAFMLGTSSLIPGALVVFDGLMILFLSRHAENARAVLLGALVVYRVLYYLLPLCVGMVTLATVELRYRLIRKKIIPDSPPL
jgi:uncharacterized membrane protein YbhN (UPF0104 family)